jgi:hypothetical protein
MKLIDSPILAHLRLIRFLAQSTLADWEYAVNCALTWAYWKMHNHILIQFVLWFCSSFVLEIGKDQVDGSNFPFTFQQCCIALKVCKYWLRDQLN